MTERLLETFLSARTRVSLASKVERERARLRGALKYQAGISEGFISRSRALATRGDRSS